MSTITPEEALTEEQLENTVAAIQAYTWDNDPGSRITDEIENRFWETITGEDNPDRDYISYDGLADGVAEQIGYINGNDNERRLPWWLDAFEWRFEMTGEGVVRVDSDADAETALDELESYAPEKTEVHKPKFQGGEKRSNIKKLLTGLRKLQTAILESSVVDRDRVSVENKKNLPDQVFDVPEPTECKNPQDPMVTTGEFNEWFKGLLELCPPFQETTSALLWYNTGLSERALDSLGINITCIKNAGITSGDGGVQNGDYRNAFCDYIMPFRGIFDRHVGGVREDTPMGYGLEAAYIHSWANRVGELSNEEITALKACAPRNIMDFEEISQKQFDEGEQARFASCCLTLPVHFGHYNSNVSLGFDTHRLKSGYSRRLSQYGIDQESRAEEIILSLETSYGLLPSQDRDDE